MVKLSLDLGVMMAKNSSDNFFVQRRVLITNESFLKPKVFASTKYGTFEEAKGLLVVDENGKLHEIKLDTIKGNAIIGYKGKDFIGDVIKIK